MGCNGSKEARRKREAIEHGSPYLPSGDRLDGASNVEALADLHRDEDVEIVLSSSSGDSSTITAARSAGKLKAAAKSKKVKKSGQRGKKEQKEKKGKKGRKAVFSRGLGSKEKTGPSRAKTPKSDKQAADLTQALSSCYLFSDLNEAERDEVVSYMWKEKLKVGGNVITQGKKSACFYLIESGSFEVLVNGKLSATLSGDSSAPFFGESGLIFGSRATATVKCVAGSNKNIAGKKGLGGKHAVVWTLDRPTFRHVISAQSQKNRDDVLSAVRSIPLLAQNLSDEQKNKLVDAVELVRVKAGKRVIKKGDQGNLLFFVRSGGVVCSNIGGEGLGEIVLGPGQYFGERALLTDEARAADVVTVEDSLLLCLSKKSFNELLGSLRSILDDNMKARVVESVPILQQLSKSLRSKVFAQFKVCKFADQEAIVREGTESNEFFVIRSGVVDIYQKGVVVGAFPQKHRGSSNASALSTLSDSSVTASSSDSASLPKGSRKRSLGSLFGTKIATLGEGDWFGEIGLLNDAPRSASCVAHGPVECYSLSYETFKLLSKKSELLLSISSRREEENLSHRVSTPKEIDFSKMTLKDITKNKILGKGTFGTVYLVESTSKSPVQGVWALKMMNKAHIVECEQTANVVNESLVLQELKHPFILTLFSTFQDRDSLYMLLEFVQGGELFSIMQLHYRLPLSHAQFYSACIVDALDYMHSMNLVYRDLKPENVLIDSKGFAKIADFGFAKRITTKTFTLCGTPEYLAPEVVLGKGHDKGVDYWAVGILIYEMLVGISPFADEYTDDQIVVCKQIVAGKINFSRLEKAISETEIKPPKSLTEKELSYVFSDSKNSGRFASGRRPSMNSRPVEHLITKLLTKAPSHRLGCLKDGAGEVKRHPFFATGPKGWADLRAKTVATPFTPTLTSKTDTSNFDDFEPDARWDSYDGPNDWCRDF